VIKLSLKNFIYGFIIGIGFIIPGVSGGVLMTILGIYDTILNKLCNIRNNFKKNILYLLPIIIGIIFSILLFSKLILYLLDNHYNFISYVFIGLITGCIPYLFKEIKNKTDKNISLLFFIISFIVGIILFLIEKNNFFNTYTPSLFTMFIAGIFYSIGKLVPGISGAALLMMLGVYEYLLNILASPLSINSTNIILLIPFVISFFISSIFIIKLLNYLLNNYFRYTYSAIIGFVISSILFILPNYISIISIIILILSFNISFNLIN